MSPQANCFQIKGSEIIPGLPHTSEILGGSPLPWSESWNKALDPGNSRQHWVKYCFHRKSGTRLITGGHEPRYIDLRAGHIFYFEVPDLQFEGVPLVEGLNLWPGAEWHVAKPFWRQARKDIDLRSVRHTISRAEIWVLKTHQALLLVDQSGKVRKLCFIHGEWSLASIELEEMVLYLSTRGLAMTTHPGVMWSLRNLELICKENPRKAFINATNGVREHLRLLES